MSKHTPGPVWKWAKAVSGNGAYDSLLDEVGEPVLSSYGLVWVRTIRDARLIEAAPKLLEAAKILLHHASDPGKYSGEWIDDCQRLEAAIALAEGDD